MAPVGDAVVEQPDGVTVGEPILFFVAGLFEDIWGGNGGAAKIAGPVLPEKWGCLPLPGVFSWIMTTHKRQ